ncbi:triose-phosphate isomerase [Candidatus Bathyarchaeota archaeon]|jgi:triosephosphate isomerase|nr:triose-phosphate isomerase [Candidatus Bathyarchaeota archaeon]
MRKEHESIMIVNFKTYSEASGTKALALSKILEGVQRETGIQVIVAAQTSDLFPLSQHVEIPVYAQHVDPQPQGGHTGHIAPEAVKESGARGTLLNHSERRLELATLEECVRRTGVVGLTSVVCANNVATAAACAAFEPDIVAVEPPELIGTGRAVSKAKPEVVTDAVARIRDINKKVVILCGAGISEAHDASSALNLGAQGILVSSAVVKATDQRKVALDMAREMSRFT